MTPPDISLMPFLGSKTIRSLVRGVVKKATYDQLIKDLPIAKQRIVMERLAKGTRLPFGVSHSNEMLGGVGCDWLKPKGADASAVMLYLHGGGYVLGSFKTHGELAGRLAKAANIPTAMPDYRLAPEHPFPAALDDALASYQGLLDSGYSADRILLGGDSAGGGLAAALLLRLKETGLPQPCCAYLISPLVDLTFSSETLKTKAAVEPLLPENWLRAGAAAYQGEHDEAEPLLSPLFGELAGLPPTLIQVGEDEILLGDSERLTAALHAATVPVRTTIWEGMWHDFQASGLGMPQRKQAIAEFGEFAREHLSKG